RTTPGTTGRTAPHRGQAGSPVARGPGWRAGAGWCAGQAMTGFYPEGALVAVLTTEPLDRLLDYKAPEGGCFDGALVEVPLGPRRVLGVVWGPGRGDFDAARVRPVGRVLDAAPMAAEMREFL